MKQFAVHKSIFLPILLGLALAGAWGCGGGGDDDDGDGIVRIGPNVDGSKWSGFYFNSATGFQEEINATITHVSNTLVVVTSKTSPPAQRFTGSIDIAGNVELTDSFDGETWTTFFGAATEEFFKIADFARQPLDQEEDIGIPIKIVELTR